MQDPHKPGHTRRGLPPASRCTGLFIAMVTLGLCLPQACLTQPDPGTVGRWAFDGDLADGSGHRNDVYAQSPRFVEGRAGSALSVDEVRATVPDGPRLRLAPGLRIECWLRCDGPYFGTQYVAVKDQEYMLRVDPPGEAMPMRCTAPPSGLTR